ncbi:hypothetical protein [Mucilaginibacter gotjawali]|uniref:Uncharacterized protein n=2 Tax=Mucilaginibacter gotjawali TaxID=1550579 RepID=A0A839SL53_9SPHI|nr:hypothetical protein [Mucilaginibacter gotjawali]MBB3058616.1 hypothetical protein [Mucilaginibacter gotjawali]BAU52417.1 hypothetical protein MgSA37_00578 [Mucilaginibacter gotjawali]
MNLFLGAKHWQLFLLTFGVPVMLNIVMMFNIFSHFGKPYGGENFNGGMIFPVMMVLFAGTLLGWMYSVAVGMQKMVPATVKMKITKFKVFFFIPVTYMVLIFFFIGLALKSPGATDLGQAALLAFAIIVPLHLFSMFCLFYCLYFVAKTIKTVELQREVTFSDFVQEFFLAWFFPIGVWILQPRINKMIIQ